MADAVQSILRFTAARPKIGDIVLNCTTREVHGAEFEIASSPIEDGARLSDHRIELQRTLDMEAIISPFPDNIVDQFRGEGLSLKLNGEDYYRVAWARIRSLASSNETFEVITDREVYPSMTFESYLQTEQNEGMIRLQARLKQVQFATTMRERFLAPNFADVGGASADVGLQGLAPL
jgi:hypothetical protein